MTVKTLDGRDSVFHIENEVCTSFCLTRFQAMNIENFKKEIEQKLVSRFSKFYPFYRTLQLINNALFFKGEFSTMNKLCWNAASF